MENQFDALLYLGPLASMTTTPVPFGLCQDVDFVQRRVERLGRFGPAIAVQNFKQACGL